jgi:Mg/Co/Ni transporter MgtE
MASEQSISTEFKIGTVGGTAAGLTNFFTSLELAQPLVVGVIVTVVSTVIAYALNRQILPNLFDKFKKKPTTKKE